jgi:hypothetical protein
MVYCKICNIYLKKRSYNEHYKIKTHNQKLKKYIDKYDNDYNNDFYFLEHLVRDGIITEDEYNYNNFSLGIDPEEEKRQFIKIYEVLEETR